LTQIDTTLLNSTLAADGSAYTFSSLAATSNFPGGGRFAANLTENGAAAITTTGTTTITISTTLSGYTTPTGIFGRLGAVNSLDFTGTTIGDTQTSGGSFNGVNTSPFTYPSRGPQRQEVGVGTGADAGTVTPPFTLDTSATLTLTSGSDAFSVNANLEAVPVPVPEPSTLTLLGLGSLGLAGYGWRRRRRTA
jgi:hypothetical protein